MKRKTICAGSAFLFGLLANGSAEGAVFTFNPSAMTVPDNSASGKVFHGTVTDLSITAIGNLTVTLQLQGGFNGDLYAYLSYGTGFAVLLNRPGRTAASGAGYSDSGMNVTFADDPGTDIHHYRYDFNGGDISMSVPNVTGVFQPDGRAISPTSSGAAFDGAARTATLASFNGLNPNGEWTLFVADRSGGGQTQVLSWELGITPVPEPREVALASALGLLAYSGWRRRGRGNRAANG